MELAGSATCTPSTIKAYGYISGFTGPKVTDHTPLAPLVSVWLPLTIWVVTLTSFAFGALMRRVTMLFLSTSCVSKAGADPGWATALMPMLSISANENRVKMPLLNCFIMIDCVI